LPPRSGAAIQLAGIFWPRRGSLGFRVTRPEGAFYLYCDCSALTDDSFTLARDLLEKAGVAATPGLDFGSNAPEKHIRFAYTTESLLAEAVGRHAATSAVGRSRERRAAQSSWARIACAPGATCS
jgi:aspartate/methionine/tyrosine aminotransferase